MKAIVLRRPGGPDVLEYTEVPTPLPGDAEVLVKADTIGVSMPEVLVRRGAYAWMPPLPAIPGIELSGTIVAHGRNVTDRAIGEAVRSKVRAYSHQGHGPRADQQAGYISATSDSTTSLAKGSRSIHLGQIRPNG
jgi:NADPH2:quinone reductase